MSKQRQNKIEAIQALDPTLHIAYLELQSWSDLVCIFENLKTEEEARKAGDL